ncbi:MAG: cupin domain-containing protein [Planctomycetota bacterium]
MATSGPTLIQLDQLPAVECPCGAARRGFADRADFPGTVHLTEIDRNARTHYHKHHTEVYVVLECQEDAAIELDGKLIPVQPKSSVLIPPLTRHRAVGNMEVLIFCLPKFDPADEFFDAPPKPTVPKPTAPKPAGLDHTPPNHTA